MATAPEPAPVAALTKRVRDELARARPCAKVVLLIWYGREEYVRILRPYLLRETTMYGGVADEIWLSMSTYWFWPDDYDVGMEWAANHPVVKTLCSKRLRKGCKAGRHDSEVWEELLQNNQDTLFVRIDDDVMYIHQGAVTSLVAHKLFHRSEAFRLHGVAVGNVINHCQLSHLHQAIGAFTPPAALKQFQYYHNHFSWANMTFAQHESFFRHQQAGTLHKYMYPVWDMNACACDRPQKGMEQCNNGWYRWCMNFFVVGGGTLQGARVVAPDNREETWISAYNPRHMQLRSESVGAALLVHFSYWATRSDPFYDKSRSINLPKYVRLSRKVAADLEIDYDSARPKNVAMRSVPIARTGEMTGSVASIPLRTFLRNAAGLDAPVLDRTVQRLEEHEVYSVRSLEALTRLPSFHGLFKPVTEQLIRDAVRPHAKRNGSLARSMERGMPSWHREALNFDDRFDPNTPAGQLRTQGVDG